MILLMLVSAILESMQMAIQRIQGFLSAIAALYWPATIFLGVIAAVLHERTGDMAVASIVVLLVLVGLIAAAAVALYRIALVGVALLLLVGLLGLVSGL